MVWVIKSRNLNIVLQSYTHQVSITIPGAHPNDNISLRSSYIHLWPNKCTKISLRLSVALYQMRIMNYMYAPRHYLTAISAARICSPCPSHIWLYLEQSQCMAHDSRRHTFGPVSIVWFNRLNDMEGHRCHQSDGYTLFTCDPEYLLKDSLRLISGLIVYDLLVHRPYLSAHIYMEASLRGSSSRRTESLGGGGRTHHHRRRVSGDECESQTQSVTKCGRFKIVQQI